MLALQDFHKQFIVEADANHKWMGIVLLQEGRHVVFFSKVFGEEHLGMSIYEKSYLSIINAVEKWKSYLLGKHFIIRMNHQSLKFLLEKKITATLQQKGMTKLIGVD